MHTEIPMIMKIKVEKAMIDSAGLLASFPMNGKDSSVKM